MIELMKALLLVNNADFREKTRRFAPAWSVVLVNERLEVVAVERFKDKPTLKEVGELTALHKDCAYFYAHPGMYTSLETLERKLQDCAYAFRIQ